MPLDKIPAGSRISRADWIIKPTLANTKVYIWRVLGDWGPGVCYQYRMIVRSASNGRSRAPAAALQIDPSARLFL